ncbi:hypothetical protein AaE_009133 [Aphanomyces astaci]|uniref:Uncharacterized protein n=1 Tax=Aphanomyces astaci TaxID=112090 RepID=A0A6A4ZT70_APHAT|nr:hypothetical protein AaE_009133 [Aphanomyces astaci]
MNDPRVARGSVYAAANSIHIKRDNAARVSQIPPNQSSGPQKSFKKQTIFEAPTTLQTFFPVDLSANLIEHTPHVDETEVSTQTDTFLPNNKHKKPFVLKKTGIEASTEIAESDGLFDFDVEVSPLLTVLVNKTLRQAMCEVEWEGELKHIALYLEELHTNKALDAEAVRELVAQAKKAYAIKDAEKVEQRRRVQESALVDEKVAAVSLSRLLMSQVVEDTTAALTAQGVFFDPLRRQVEGNFMAWMYSAADTIVKTKQSARVLVEGCCYLHLVIQVGATDLTWTPNLDMVRSSLQHQRLLHYVDSLHTQVHDNMVTIPVANVPGLDAIGPVPYSRNVREFDRHIDVRIGYMYVLGWSEHCGHG